jgi:hypothetical protein
VRETGKYQKEKTNWPGSGTNLFSQQVIKPSPLSLPRPKDHH